MPLTLEERERQAYIEGRTQEAADIARAIDAVDERIDEAEHEARAYREQVTQLDAQNDRLQDELEEAETEIAELRDRVSELENGLA